MIFKSYLKLLTVVLSQSAWTVDFARAMVYDNFQQEGIDTCRCNTNFFAGSGLDMIQTGGKLSFTVYKNANQGTDVSFNAAAKSKTKISGDFEVQVDFDHSTWPVDPPNGIRTGLYAVSDTGGAVVEYANLWEFPTASALDDNKYVFHAGDTGALTVDADPQGLNQGSLKLTRVGDVVRGYFLNKDGIYQEVGNGSNVVGSDDVSLMLDVCGEDYTFVHTHDIESSEVAVEASFDNIRITAANILPYDGDGCSTSSSIQTMIEDTNAVIQETIANLGLDSLDLSLRGSDKAKEAQLEQVLTAADKASDALSNQKPPEVIKAKFDVLLMKIDRKLIDSVDKEMLMKDILSMQDLLL